MNTKTKLTVIASLLLAAPLAFACDYPERPAVPDGDTASKDEMLAAAAGVKSYLAAVDEYLTCIEAAESEAVAELEEPTEQEIARRDDMIGKKFEAANEEKAMVGEMFNQQVRAYNDARAERKAAE